MKNYVLLFFLIGSGFILAQEQPKDTIVGDQILIANDSMTMALDEVILFKHRKFKSPKERRYYYWYYKKVHKAYPYARTAAEKLSEINKSLEGIKSKRKRKKHIKKIQKFMEGEFTSELKKLTKTEGRILIKLVHRQTGETMFQLIKEYRSGWNAFWYNSTANMFKLSLKSEYQPDKNALDFVVEDILQRSFAKGTLEKQASPLQFDYFELLNQWENINIDKELQVYIDKYLK